MEVNSKANIQVTSHGAPSPPRGIGSGDITGHCTAFSSASSLRCMRDHKLYYLESMGQAEQR